MKTKKVKQKCKVVQMLPDADLRQIEFPSSVENRSVEGAIYFKPSCIISLTKDEYEHIEKKEKALFNSLRFVSNSEKEVEIEVTEEKTKKEVMIKDKEASEPITVKKSRTKSK